MKTLVFLEGGLGKKNQNPKPARFLANDKRHGYEVGANLYWMLSTDLQEGSPLKREELLEIFEDGVVGQKLLAEEQAEAEWVWRVVLPKGKRQAYGFKLYGTAPNGKTYYENFSLPKAKVMKARVENDMRHFTGVDEGDGRETDKVKRTTKTYLYGLSSENYKNRRREISKKQLRDEHGRFVKKVK